MLHTHNYRHTHTMMRRFCKQLHMGASISHRWANSSTGEDGKQTDPEEKDNNKAIIHHFTEIKQSPNGPG